MRLCACVSVFGDTNAWQICTSIFVYVYIKVNVTSTALVLYFFALYKNADIKITKGYEKKEIITLFTYLPNFRNVSVVSVSHIHRYV